MATLLVVYVGAVVVGRCDGRCYDADTERCTCVCEGMNHGAGLEAALDNTRAHVDAWVAAERKRRPEVDRWSVDIAAQTLPLFDLAAVSGR